MDRDRFDCIIALLELRHDMTCTGLWLAYIQLHPSGFLSLVQLEQVSGGCIVPACLVMRLCSDTDEPRGALPGLSIQKIDVRPGRRVGPESWREGCAIAERV